MNKLLIVLFVAWIIGVIWTVMEIYKGIKNWIKREREEILKDE